MTQQKSIIDGRMHNIHDMFNSNTNLQTGRIAGTKDAPLAEGVKYVGMAYPFTDTLAHWQPWAVVEVKTRHELIRTIRNLCRQHNKEGRNYGCHKFADYYLEHIEIWGNGMAVFTVGA